MSCITRNHCGLTPFHSDEKPLDPRTEGRSGRLAAPRPRTGHEPNVTVEISSAEVTTNLQPSRRASFCSLYNSGEDVTTTLVSSDVNERQSMGDLLRCTSHERKSSSDPRSVQETHSARARTRTEHQEVRDQLKLRADEAPEGGKAALSRLSEAESHTRLLLEEQKNQKLSEARSGMNMQELKTESADLALRILNRQIRSHLAELYHTNQKMKLTERAGPAPSRIGQPRNSPSRNSYWNSPGSGRIEKALQC